jgi:hypothetical protein
VPRPHAYSPADFVSPQRLQRRSAGAGFGMGPGVGAVAAQSPRVGGTRTHETRAGGARRSLGYVLDDQDGQPVRVVVIDANDLERPAS